MTRLREVLVVLATSLLFGGWALSQSFVGPYLKLGVQDESTFSDAGAYLQGALVYGSDAGMVYVNNGSGWTALSTGGSGSSASFFFDAGSGFMATTTPLVAGVTDGGPVLDITNPLNATTGFLFFPADNVGGTTNKLKTSYASFGYLPVYNNSLEIRTSDVFVHAGDTGGTGSVGYGAGAQALSIGQDYEAIGGGLSIRSSGLYGMPLRASLFWAPTWFGRSQQGVALESYNNDPLLFQVNSGSGIAESHMMRLTSAGALESYQSSGNNSFANLTNGARFDLGTGTNDYLYGDGTGILSPSYVQSTRTFSTGPGFIAPSLRASGSADTGFAAGTASASGVGTLAYNTTFNQMMLQNSASGFGPVAQPHIVNDRQTFSTRIIGLQSSNAPPQLAEKVSTDNTGGTLQTYWTTSGTVITAISTTAGHTVYTAVTGAEVNTRLTGTTAASTAPSTLKPLTSVRLNPQMCQWVIQSSSPSLLAQRWWVGLVDTLPTTGSIMNGNGVMFRLDTTVNTNLFLCARDGTTQTCVDTNVTIAAAGAYQLCVKYDGSAWWGWVNGQSVAKATANLPAATVQLAPVDDFVNLSASSNAFAFGVWQVESL